MEAAQGRGGDVAADERGALAESQRQLDELFLLVLAPVAALVNLLPGAAGPLALIIAVVFAWGIKQAVIEPVGMAALMQVFFKVTEGQQPNPEWEGKLDSVSKKFSLRPLSVLMTVRNHLPRLAMPQ